MGFLNPEGGEACDCFAIAPWISQVYSLSLIFNSWVLFNKTKVTIVVHFLLLILKVPGILPRILNTNLFFGHLNFWHQI